MVAAFVERVEFHARSTPRWKVRGLRDDALSSWKVSAIFGMTHVAI